MAGPPSGLWAERGHPGLVGGRAAERPCPCPCPCPWSEPDPKRGGTQPFHGETVAWRRCSRENQFPLTLLHRETIGGVVMPLQGPTVVRRQLGRRLRRLREAAGKTERDLEEANLVSRAKLWRIESGRTPVKVPDVRPCVGSMVSIRPRPRHWWRWRSAPTHKAGTRITATYYPVGSACTSVWRPRLLSSIPTEQNWCTAYSRLRSMSGQSTKQAFLMATTGRFSARSSYAGNGNRFSLAANLRCV